MNSTSSSYDLNLSTDIIPTMSDTILDHSSNQPLITTDDKDRNIDDKHVLSNQDNSTLSGSKSFYFVFVFLKSFH